jgi:tetratricopeptide (TPR) repeat protein/predicted Ser/Thr protein kinase
MGEIWLAEDPVIGRSVALKRMLGRRPDQVHRFEVEAQVTGQLEHPGIVPVHELGVDAEGLPFYVMKFVHGRTLQNVIEEYHAADPRRSLREVEQFRLLQIFLSLCQTVAYAHSRGVLHRDLKPDNVMIGPYGETLLLDWGIAKVLGQPEGSAGGGEASYVHLIECGPETETQAGAILGTPSYMAPESAAGLTAEIDQRSDVYLLGATLYEILTGRRPRSATTALEMVKLAQSEPPIPAATVNADVPKALSAISAKAMAHRKEDRYQGALELAEDIQCFVAGESVSAYPDRFPARAWRWALRHRKALERAAAAALILGVSLVGFAQFRAVERHRVEAQRVADRLTAQEQARRDVQEFRHLADEARFYAATTDPVAENAPYFDPHQGEAKALAALTLATKWGPTLERLLLPDEADSLKRELYDLLLLTAHVQSQQAVGPDAARETLALLDRAARLGPPSRSDFRLRALADRRRGDDRKAAEEQQRAEDPRGQSTSLDHFLLGESYRKTAAARPGETSGRNAWQPDPERMERAIDQYRQALRIDPDHYWSHFQLGRSYLSLLRLAEAVEALGACVALRPDAPWGYSVRGLALAQQKRYRDAEQDLDRAIRLNPDSLPARLNRGVVYWRQGKFDEALADFDAVLKPPKEKRLIEAAFCRGQLYLQRGEVRKALEDFDCVVAENPRIRTVFLYRAQLQISQGDNDHGLEDLDTYLDEGSQRDPRVWVSHGLRGHLLRDRYQQLPLDKRRQPSGLALLSLSVAELGKAVTLGGRASDLFDDLGAMLEHAGRPGQAILSYSQGLELAPKDAKLLVKRGWAFELLKQHGKASADFAAATRVDPENAEAHTGLGYVRALLKHPAEAQREADLALLHGADQYLILHNVACIYAALSQASDDQAPAHQEAAIALLRRAIALWKRAEADAKPGPSEIDLIQGEPAFQPLRGRADFQQLSFPPS